MKNDLWEEDRLKQRISIDEKTIKQIEKKLPELDRKLTLYDLMEALEICADEYWELAHAFEEAWTDGAFKLDACLREGFEALTVSAIEQVWSPFLNWCGISQNLAQEAVLVSTETAE